MTSGTARVSLEITLVATCLALSRPAHGQVMPSIVQPIAPSQVEGAGEQAFQTADSGRVSAGWLVLGAIAGGAASAGIGALLSGPIQDGAVWGAVSATAEITLVPLGAHLANKRRGNYALDLAASALIGTAGILLAAQFGEDQRSRQVFYISLAALGQIAAVVSLERWAERH